MRTRKKHGALKSLLRRLHAGQSILRLHEEINDGHTRAWGAGGCRARGHGLILVHDSRTCPRAKAVKVEGKNNRIAKWDGFVENQVVS